MWSQHRQPYGLYRYARTSGNPGSCVFNIPISGAAAVQGMLLQ